MQHQAAQKQEDVEHQAIDDPQAQASVVAQVKPESMGQQSQRIDQANGVRRPADLTDRNRPFQPTLQDKSNAHELVLDRESLQN